MTTPNDDLTIGDNEVVIRRVGDDQHTFDNNIGRRRPATAAFLQDGADGLVSVYLLAETTPGAVAGEGGQPYQVTIRVRALRENGLGIIRTPERGGPRHCDVTGRKTKGRLNRIVKQAEWIPEYEPTLER